MGALSRDIKFGVRIFAKSPGFTAITVLTLALGIGGSATVFSWVRGVLLHPLPGIANVGQLVAVETILPNGTFHTSSYPDFRDFRAQNQVFSDMIGVELMPVDMTWAGQRQDRRVWGEIVTENYFHALGVSAQRGRVFEESDASRGPSGDPDLILSHSFWQRQFGGAADILGRTIQINRHDFTVVGIAPRNFQGTIVGIAPDFWVPMMMQPVVLPGESLVNRSPTFLHLLGVLKLGVSIAQAQANLGSLTRNIAREYPESSRNVGVAVEPISKAHYGVQDLLRSALILLSVVALVVLLIGCANVANLLLARAAGRDREIAVRSSLGATRSVLVRQLIIESVLLGLAGGLGGVLLASWLSRMLLFFLPSTYLPIGLPLGVDGEVLAFTLSLSIVTGVVAGLVPALRASRPNLNESLKDGGRSNSSGMRHHRLRGLLVISEMALALALVAAAGLLLRSLRNVQSASPGFNPHHVLLAAFDLRGDGYSSAQARAYYEKLMDHLRTVPGVESVSCEQYVPLWFYGQSTTRPTIEGYTPRPNEDMDIGFNIVGPDYFQTMQIPIVAGHEFSTEDREGQPFVAIVNQTMARRFWPGQSPLGHSLKSSGGGHWYTIVGVAHDIKYHTMTEQPQSFIYFPTLQTGETDTNVMLRTSGDPAVLLPIVRQQAASIDPNVGVLQAGSLTGILYLSLFAYRTAATLASVLGALGLLLASLGIYGVLSYAVSQRTHEIGIRIALGADPLDVLGMVVRQGAKLALIGVAIGFAGALAVTRLMTSLLYGVSPSDPLTLAAVVLVIAVATLLACYIPARRAMRLDPTVALRAE
ncbi:MAG: ABC transporter permease [Acidobacteriota bacterium]|nr:ABC transporter permease [Acidobacteriota bacterium]